MIGGKFGLTPHESARGPLSQKLGATCGQIAPMVSVLPIVPVRKYCAVYYLTHDSYHGMEEVIGSIPIRSTKTFQSFRSTSSSRLCRNSKTIASRPSVRTRCAGAHPSWSQPSRPALCLERHRTITYSKVTARSLYVMSPFDCLVLQHERRPMTIRTAADLGASSENAASSWEWTKVNAGTSQSGLWK